MHRLAFGLTAVAILCSAATGHADQARARLQYSIDDAAALACPGESGMRAAIIDVLRYDPFDPGASLAVFAHVRREEAGLHGEIHARDAEGRLVGSRSILAGAGDCPELVKTMAFAIAIAIDPWVAAHAVNPSPDRPTEPVRAPVGLRPRVRIGAGAELALAVLPGDPAAGIGASAALRWPWFSVEIGGEALLPRSRSQGFGLLTAEIWLGTAAGCFYYGRWLGCARASLGALHGSATVALATDRITPYASLGVAAGAELPLSEVWTIRITAHTAVPVLPTKLEVDKLERWTTPRVGGGLGFAVFGDFF
jgi:hypothetical protein